MFPVYQSVCMCIYYNEKMNKYKTITLMLMYRPIVLRDIYRGLAVQIYGKSMKIGKHGNFGTLISKRLGLTLDFAHEGRNLQSKMADIENVYFS